MHFSNRHCLAFVFLIGVYLTPAIAVAAGLYTGTAPVNSQSDEDRAGALRIALGQVLVKLSGDPTVLSRPEVTKALARADRYMQQYSYAPNTGADTSQSAARLLLVVQFDRDGIDGILRDPGLGTAHDAGASTAADTPAPAAATGSYRLWINGLRSAENYARLIGALSGNEQVRMLRVEQAHGNGVQVKVETRGALQDLLNALDATRVAHSTSGSHPPVEGIDALLDFEP